MGVTIAGCCWGDKDEGIDDFRFSIAELTGGNLQGAQFGRLQGDGPPNADFIRNPTVGHGGKVSKTQPFPPYKERVVGREWSLDLRAESNMRAFLYHLPPEDSIILGSMHIAFLMQDTGKIYGAERATLDLVKTLSDANKCRVTVYLMNELRLALSRSEIVVELEQMGVATVSLSVRRAFSPLLVRALRAALRRDEVDVLHTVGYKADLHGGWAAGFGRVVPVVSTVHGWLCRPDIKERFYGWLNMRVLRRFQSVIALSRYYEDFLRRSGVPAEVLVRIPSGYPAVDGLVPNAEFIRNSTVGHGGKVSKTQPFPPYKDRVVGREWSSLSAGALAKAEDLRAESDIYALLHHRSPENSKATMCPLVVGVLGRLSWEKNHDMFLAVAEALRDTKSPVRFVIAGDGPEASRIQQAIEARGLTETVEMRGYVPAAELFPEIHVLTLCSRIENLPYSLLEAMAAGVPVVATRVGGVPDLVEDGVNGYLVETQDAEAMADRIRAWLRAPDTLHRMAEAGLTKLQAEFSVDRQRDEHLALYESLASRRML